MRNSELSSLYQELDAIDEELLALLSRRASVAVKLGELRQERGLPKFDPAMEQETLEKLIPRNPGPLGQAAVRRLFHHIFTASFDPQAADNRKRLLVSRQTQEADTIIRVHGAAIGGGTSTLVAGPCAVESYEQLRETAAALKEAGVRIMRGGAFKPRTSPYDFQGLGLEGLKLLREVADEFGLAAISEIVTPHDIETAARYVDIIQIGARNMQNFELLKAAGDVRTPVLLKRGLAATLEEFLLAAEYIVSRGNTQVMLIERGIRTYEKWTRNTLDISAVPILKQESHLPVLVDVTHSTGRKDIMLPCAKAALAAGADGIMVEVHPNPQAALSDAGQQFDIPEFRRFHERLLASGLFRVPRNGIGTLNPA
ncbi:bifunctional 3-deoxy-7-phosphoheptulonate synthase/chorismate mutase [Paenibacillus cisolokensis]|uniref:Bifunctional 3-deoxy-7-phosphoheptulonate synthase/chorismate mutase n=1 Tax=Paenibacillus cisolokensis TaxID=1658519 RepID=A0ABQ4NFQ8_9BACL|nr:bifunctional 3-deoxy-7-phosphoheptulonate synthase/chorismate mutase [Paenibacillus cisolokensis]GIQ66890.1 bifunctional 3-deoxy-7-phosphoheptulonate synthase/chorismate mutase [Paenibacillus cisolokensis]